MSSTGALQADGTRCYAGPACKRHGTETRQAALRSNIEALLTQPVTPTAPPEPVSPYRDFEEYRQALLTILYENDEDTDDHFTAGACHLFAKALHEATGYPIIAIKHQTKRSWSHMGVRAPDGRFWDVTGPYPKDTGVLDDWTGTHTHVPEGEGILQQLTEADYAYLTEGVDKPEDYVMDPAPAVEVITRAMQLIPPRTPENPS